MTSDKARALLASEAVSVMKTVMPDARVMKMPTSSSAESVTVTAFDASDVRPVRERAADLAVQLRASGWKVLGQKNEQDEGQSLFVSKTDVGGGVFGIQTAAMSFAGVVSH